MLLEESIIGHADTQADLLRSIVDDRFAHAHLFVGPQGIGKKLVAGAIAKALVCESPDAEGKACQECHQCKMASLGTHPDIAYFDRDKTNYSVQHLRESILDWAARRPREGNLKIGIIDSADRLGSASANAFLKTLEEPPAGTKWILLSSDLSGVITTIVSRCRLVHFSALSTLEVEKLAKGPLAEALEEALTARAALRGSGGEDEEESGLSPAENAFALSMAQGSPGHYLEVLSDDLITRRDWILERLIGRDKRGVISVVEEFIDNHKHASDATQEPMRGRLIQSIDLMSGLLRDLILLARDAQTILINNDAKSRVKRVLKRFDPLMAESSLERLSELSGLVRRNVSPRLIAANALFALEDCLQ